MLAWLYIASEWLIRVGMVPVVVRRRQPSAALAWLAVIFFLPWFGLAVYLLVGTRRLGRRRALRHETALSSAAAPRLRSSPEPHVVHPDVDPRQRDLVRLAEHVGDMPILGGNAVEVITDTDVMIEKLIADIAAAKHHVHLLYYIFRNDETGRRVSAAVEQAAARGVRCRVLADAVGSGDMLRGLAPGLRAAGVEVAAALPVNPVRLLLARIDLRNHRKLAVIDGRVAHTGSQNIVNADYGDKRVGMWQDLSIRLTGPSVMHFQLVFLQDWFAETGHAIDPDGLFPDAGSPGNVAVQIVPSGPTSDTRGVHELLVAAIHEAERRLIITSPYLVPSEPLMTALRVAVLRGVEVDLVVPARSDQILPDAAARAYFADLAEIGVRLHLHREGLLHAKTLTVDESFALIGSANFDTRSFDLNFELTVLLFGREVTDLVRWSQKRYLDQSVPLDADRWRLRPRAYRLADNLARLLGPLL